MTNQRFIQTPGTSQGAALVMGLVILLIISALSITSMRGSSMELRMASNTESGISAYQIVQAVSDYIAQTPVTTPVVGGAGYTYCTANEVGCSDTSLSLAAGMYTSELSAGHIGVRIERKEDRGIPRGGAGQKTFVWCRPARADLSQWGSKAAGSAVSEDRPGKP
jgi:hypothetical protein